MKILIVADDEDDGEFLSFACNSVVPNAPLTLVPHCDFGVNVLSQLQPTHLFILIGILEGTALLHVQDWIDNAVTLSTKVIILTSFLANKGRLVTPQDVTVISKPASLAGLKQDIRALLLG